MAGRPMPEPRVAVVARSEARVGECWLKWQTDPAHPLYGQRGKYTDEFRRRNRDKHLNGLYPPASDKHSVEAPHRE